jgi:hypothetical protein
VVGADQGGCPTILDGQAIRARPLETARNQI